MGGKGRGERKKEKVVKRRRRHRRRKKNEVGMWGKERRGCASSQRRKGED
eukprot:gene30243-46689_t